MPGAIADWEFPGWGEVTYLDSSALQDGPAKGAESSGQRRGNCCCPSEDENLVGKAHHAQPSLGEWTATALAGNDITASCLYAPSLCVAQAGALSPAGLVIVAFVLYMFRKVYAEVGLALRVNGGCFSILLNTTSKKIAALGACLSLIAYIATAVVSANTAAEYLHGIWEDCNVILATIIILGIFATLNFVGISESSTVALIIFVFHLMTLMALVIVCFVHMIRYPEVLQANYSQPLYVGQQTSNKFIAVVLGYSTAMLGVTGFETSSNYIEEQKPGVFPKTLRNMWIAVSFFNPLLGFLALGTIDAKEITDKYQSNMLSQMALVGAGKWFQILVSVDALLVLSGSVLTSYVGVGGLLRRMAVDRCMPRILMQRNFRGSFHWIILVFFLLCTALVGICASNFDALSAVYTIAFLCVMALFALGNLMLKYKRRSLPREIQSPVWATVVGLFLVLVALIGNVGSRPQDLLPFLIFFVAAVTVVMLMFVRFSLVKFLINILHNRLSRIKPVPLLEYQDMTSVQAKSLEADEPPVMVLPGTALAAGVTVRSLSTGAVGTSPKDLERLEVGQVEEEEEDSGLGQQAPQRTFSQHAIPVTVIGENPPPVEGMQFVSTPVDSEGTPILSFQPEGPLSPSHREDMDVMDRDEFQGACCCCCCCGYHGVRKLTCMGKIRLCLLQWSARVLKDLSRNRVVFFVKHPSLPIMNKAVLYIRDNELTSDIHFVHVHSCDAKDVSPQLTECVQILDEMYPKIRMNLVLIHGSFGPSTVQLINQVMKIPPNFMFITCPDARFTHHIGSLGGVRVITGN